MIKRYLLFIPFFIALVIPPYSFGIATDSVKGVVQIIDGHYHLRIDGNPAPLIIIPTNPATRTHLTCLKHGDFLSGTTKGVVEQQLILNSIDYVYLNALLGVWRDDHDIYKFEDYRNLYYWTFSETLRQRHGPYYYRYALSPYGESQQRCRWKVFFYDNLLVTLASLEWASANQIRLQIYDADTGEVNSSKLLSRGVLLQ